MNEFLSWEYIRIVTNDWKSQLRHVLMPARLGILEDEMNFEAWLSERLGPRRVAILKIVATAVQSVLSALWTTGHLPSW